MHKCRSFPFFVCISYKNGHNLLVGADFYNRVKAAHTVVQTGEPRLYANVILRKGVIYPSA